ncbi:hypothetical protein [Microbacterium sp. NPDC077184]|uniref:hypothetical protein n=1 Tax=Microbacterium sp. NPDC077184 TaxID=3154764 RepID=UPI0034313A1F
MNHPARIGFQILNVLAAAAVIVVTLVLCGGALFFAALTGDTSYRDPRTAAGWIRVIVQSTSDLLLLSAILAVALIVACTIVVGAALLRRKMWIIIGGVCSILIAFAQIGVVSARSEVDDLANRATAAVGSAVAIESPPLVELAPEPITVQDARDEMTRMLQATLAAAVAPVADENHDPITADQVEIRTTACGDEGVRIAAALTLTTGDNSGSLAAILGAWDRGGYLPDRAMQEDIRYSTTLPLERMSIRDKTTIDGLLQIGISSTCAVADQ